uniref:Uncharacterized protein n=1 Tax=Zea mays TaxID=4577 RepID=A0A804M4D4_MAIZE
MVKEEEMMAEAGGGRGYMDLLGLGEEDYLLCLSPPSYFTPSVVSATATTTAAASASTCCAASYLDLDLAPAYHHTLSFGGQDQEQQHHGDDGGCSAEVQPDHRVLLLPLVHVALAARDSRLRRRLLPQATGFQEEEGGVKEQCVCRRSSCYEQEAQGEEGEARGEDRSSAAAGLSVRKV